MDKNWTRIKKKLCKKDLKFMICYWYMRHNLMSLLYVMSHSWDNKIGTHQTNMGWF